MTDGGRGAATPPARNPPGRRQQRAVRTRLKIKSALIELLDERDFFELTITDICRAAQVATGGFYFHFAKKADLIHEVIEEHSAALWAALDAALLYLDPYSALFHATTTLARGYRDSPGLVRCFNRLAMTDRAYVRMWEEAARRWVATLVQMLRAAGVDDGGLDEGKAYALLSFADLLLLKIYVDQDPILTACAGGLDEVIENVAVLWHRGLVGCSPPAGRLAFAAVKKGV